MSKAQIELIKQGLKAGDPEELVSLLYKYYSKAQRRMDAAYNKGEALLRSEEPKEVQFDRVKKYFEKAADELLNAAMMFDLDCMIDLLNCED